MTLKEKQQQIIDDFSLYEEWLDKYEYIIELGKALPPFPEELKTEDRLIKGCQSRVWLNCEVSGGVLNFTADSDQGHHQPAYQRLFRANPAGDSQ